LKEDSRFQQFIIGEPDVAVFDLVGDEEFIVLACDGLWDVMRPEEVVDFVREHTKRNAEGKALPGVAEELADHAISEGTCGLCMGDNESCFPCHRCCLLFVFGLFLPFPPHFLWGLLLTARAGSTDNVSVIVAHFNNAPAAAAAAAAAAPAAV
jgi:hypothetical protein